jgi:TPR repeat protein
MFRSLAIALFALALWPTHALADGKRYAVVVGVQKYDDPAFTAPEFTERDATELAGALTTTGYEVALLTDTKGGTDKSLEPTRANIEKALKTALGKCKRDDLVLVAFAGHGTRADTKSAGYLCPRDAKPLPDGTASLIAVDGLCTDLSKSEAGAAVLLVDACRMAPAGDQPGGIDGSGLKVPERVFALFSCSPGERALEHKDIRHGVFFNQVLAGLKGAAADGDDAITVAALANYLRAEVPKQASKLVKDAKQSPALQAPGVTKQSPVVARHPATVPVAEWEEYLRTWSNGSTNPFLLKYAPKRVAEWRKAAEAGSARGMMLLGDCYEMGAGVTKDSKLSAQWYTKSAERGNTFAMVGLGMCYQRGFGVAKDEKEAVKWFRKGAELGDAGCMELLGGCYQRGQGVAKDAKEALKWFRKSADLGFGQAVLSVGMCYLDGKGVEKDEKEAVKWFHKGVEQKNGSCAVSLGLCYKEGKGVEKDEKEAVKWFRTGFELGSADGALLLGISYQGGEGVEKDEKEAVNWFRKAADLGDALAMNILARCYLEGTGVEMDEKQAVAWLRKAADLDDASAMLGLGVLYLNGIGVEKDRSEAIRWLRKAATLGNARAKELLKELSD